MGYIYTYKGYRLMVNDDMEYYCFSPLSFKSHAYKSLHDLKHAIDENTVVFNNSFFTTTNST